ncbi:TIR domain-containing protein [Streptomyces bathyalis]|uniref:TIR domain-containing protein n=1 Tax=Streptomyces bathyalis TaxID=2710756 RepID=A0A7T1WUN7_9ACTN|nr:TIR domain-containing protein [Streptomyces bathyalis]QPP08110.1 TIR domain-containing protein [Streptomyces bathyalis]
MSCLACWGVFLPFLGPWLALCGLLIPITVFFPFPSTAVLWGWRKIRVTYGWSWGRLLRVETVALPVALVALGGVALLATSSRWPVLWWLMAVLLPMGIAACLVAAAVEVRPAAVEIRPADVPDGPGEAGTAAGTVPGGTALRGRVLSVPALAARAALIAVLSGLYVWALGWAARGVGTGNRQPATARIEKGVRWADAQLASSLFGPTYDRQWYWAFLVGAAALLAAGCALLMRNALRRTAAATDPFEAAAGTYEAPAGPTGKVFLSYSRKDTDFARRLSPGLQERLGELWVDWQAINPSEEWRESIARAVRTSDAFVVLLSREALSSTHCWDECRQAMELRKRILPVVIDPELERSSTSGLMRERGWGELTAYQKLPLVEPDEEELAQGVADIADFVHQQHRWVAFHSRLTNLAHQWWESGRAEGLLLRSEELSVAEAWQQHAPDEADFHTGLTEKQRRYLDESRRSVRRRTLRARSLLAAGTAVVVALSGLVAAGQAGAENQYRTALSRKLAALSGDVAGTDPEKSLQYALAARGQADTAEARSAIAERLDAYDAVRTVIAPRGAPVQDVALSRKGDLLIIDRGETTEVWDVKRARSRGLLEGSLLHSGDGGHTALSGDGRTVALQSNDRRRVDLVDTAKLTVKDRFSTAEAGVSFGQITDGQLSPDGKRLLLSGWSSSANESDEVVWDVRRHRLADQSGCFGTMSPSGRSVLCEDGDDFVLRHLTDSGAEEEGGSTELDADADSASFVAFTTRDGALFNVDGEARVYEPGEAKPRVPVPGKAVASWQRAGGPAVFDGRYAVLAEDGKEPFEMWDLLENRRIASASNVEKAIEEGRDGRAPKFEPAWSNARSATPDGSLHASAAADGSVVLWGEDGPGRVSRKLPVPGKDDPYAISPDARTVASATGESVSTWDTRAGRRTGSFQLDGIKGALAFDRSGSLLAVAVMHAPADRDHDEPSELSVEVFRTRDGKRVARLDAGEDSRNHVGDLMFSPGGKKLYGALTGAYKVVEWDLADSGEKPRTVAKTDGYADHAVLSEDGTKLATVSRQGTVGVWDTDSGDRLRTFHEAYGAAFSPDGRTLATTHGGRSVSLWNLRSGKRSGSEFVPEGGAGDVQFSPDGRRLAVVGSPDGGLAGELPVTLWDLSSRRPVGPRLATVHNRGAVRIAPDGDTLVTAGRFGTSVVDVTPGGRVASLCGMVTRKISERDWQEVAPGERLRWPC